jgi:PAS domain S-box-containing protein
MRTYSITQEQVLKYLGKVGSRGATILEIEANVDVERHTLSKYLSLMEKEGVILHQAIGKAKIYRLDKAPLKTILNNASKHTHFVERTLTQVLQQMPTAVFVTDKQSTIEFANAKAQQQYPACEEKSLWNALGTTPQQLSVLSQVFSKSAPIVSFTVQTSADKYLRIDVSQHIHPDKSVHALVLVDDITQEMKSQQTILAQKQLLAAERDALNKAAIVAETDLKGVITYVNDKFVDISGFSAKELLGKTHRIVNSGHHPKQFWADMWKTISAGKVWQGLVKNRRKDGSFYWVDAVIAPVLDQSGKPVKYLAIRYDVTAWMEAKEQKN